MIPQLICVSFTEKKLKQNISTQKTITLQSFFLFINQNLSLKKRREQKGNSDIVELSLTLKMKVGSTTLNLCIKDGRQVSKHLKLIFPVRVKLYFHVKCQTIPISSLSLIFISVVITHQYPITEIIYTPQKILTNYYHLPNKRSMSRSMSSSQFLIINNRTEPHEKQEVEFSSL